MSRRPIRVLHVVKGLGRGGAETLLRNMAREWDPSDVCMSVAYFLPQKSQLVDEIESAGAEVTLIHRRRLQWVHAVGALRTHIQQRQIDLIHCHLPASAVVGRIAGRTTNTPVVYTQHGPLEHSNRYSQIMNLRTWRYQDHVIAVSPEVEGSVAQYAPIGPPVTLVQNGIPTDWFAPDAARRAQMRRRLGLAESDVLVGTVAVFRPQKRLDLWLDAAARLRTKHPKVRFVIVGAGPLEAELEARAHELGLDQTLSFVGLQEDVRPYLDAMDLYLMTSDFEGLPIALLEAMSMAVPPVCTSVGGIPDVLADGASGVLCSPGDIPGLVAAVGSLIDDEARRSEIGALARRRVEESHGLGVMLNELEDVYRLVLERVGVGAGAASPQLGGRA